MRDNGEKETQRYKALMVSPDIHRFVLRLHGQMGRSMKDLVEEAIIGYWDMDLRVHDHVSRVHEQTGEGESEVVEEAILNYWTPERLAKRRSQKKK